tara:strand:- start:44288 stop:44500 length:213 start_codon:yes stop_codon:yes gene_type:complete
VSRTDLIIEEARLNNGRNLTHKRGEELAHEIEALMDASRELRKLLSFDDQASDFMAVAIETSPMAGRPRK